MKKVIVAMGMMMMSAVMPLFAGENPRSYAKNVITSDIVVSEPPMELETWMLRVFDIALKPPAGAEAVQLEPWMTHPEVFMKGLPMEEPQQVEPWMLQVSSFASGVDNREQEIPIEPWMLQVNF